MCGRYSLGLRPSAIRVQLRDTGMYAESTPDDDDVRETYNFAPGYYGVVYRADTPDWGFGTAGGNDDSEAPNQEDEPAGETEQSDKAGKPAEENATPPKYKLQAMKWGLVPFWTKRNPDYSSLMRTINCRDDSLYEDRGMWTSMKRKKRCVVIAQGFFEWQKKNNGKEKIPHFIKRADGKLMCFAGLWDSVIYEGSEEKLYTYTIITTSPNKQMTFLHDRMPVILENGSEDMFTWLNPTKNQWSDELQSLLRPFEGGLELYPVSKDVGKVGNNSSNFIVPVASADNKKNIANFFTKPGTKNKHDDDKAIAKPAKIEEQTPEAEQTPTKVNVKRERVEMSEDPSLASPPSKSRKVADASTTNDSSPKKPSSSEDAKPKTRSAISNATKSPGKAKTPLKQEAGSQKITKFFGK